MKKRNTFELKDYGVLFALSFADFILYSFYILLSLVVIGDISIISGCILIMCLFSAISFAVKYQYEYNKIVTKKNRTKKKSKIYNTNPNLNKKNYRHSKFEEQI